jgi:molecular chaperone DnaK
MSLAIGIDLGTTNTVVASVIDGVATTLHDQHGRHLIPSVVSFHPSGDVLVGDLARARRWVDAENTIYSVKRLIGRPWSAREVQDAAPRFPFALKAGPRDTTMVGARGIDYLLPEISAFVLRQAKAVAEAALGTRIDKAVITVPANFNELQRASTKVAGRLAGLEVLRILNEPTAAALAYGQTLQSGGRAAVFDLGGGTFDITILDLSGDVFEVLATAGDMQLGGDDVDTRVAELCAERYLRTHRYDPRASATEYARLRLVAEELKCELSRQPVAERQVDTVGTDAQGQPLVTQLRLTRDELEQVARPLVSRTLEVTRGALAAAQLQASDIDHVILVGGSTRMPLVVEAVTQFFGKPITQSINPDEVVAIGAAIQAQNLNRDKLAKPNVVLHAGDHLKSTLAGVGHGLRATAADAGAGVRTTAAGVAPASPVLGPGPRPLLVKREPPRVIRGATAEQIAQVLQNVAGAPSLDAPATASAPATGPVKAPPPLPPRARVATGTNEASARGGMPSRPNEMPEHTLSLPRQSPTLTFEEQPIPPPVWAQAPADNAASADNVAPAGNTLELDLSGWHADAALVAAEPQSDALTASQSDALTASQPDALVGEPVPLLLDLPADALPPQRIIQTREDAMVETRGKATLLIDVTPLSLRVETAGGYSDMLIGANTPVPCERTRTFLTASDYQARVVVRVAQGESARFADNTFLGEVELSGIREAVRGEVKIAVTFELDADGTLNVRAKEEGTTREARAQIRLTGSVSEGADLNDLLARQAARNVVG